MLFRSSLQQAGLAVTVKRITKDNPKYEGKEGTVINRVPSAGGIAMLGSSISITVYKTGQGNQGGYGGEGGSTGGQWEDNTGQDDGQQSGSDQPDGQDQWDSGNDSGGWQPPPQGDNEGVPDSSGNPDIGINHGGMRIPPPWMPVGKHDGGTIGARSGMPSNRRLEQIGRAHV